MAEDKLVYIEAQKTRLKVPDVPLTSNTYAQVFWLLKKYTSYTYIERMYRLYATFVRGYNEWAKTQPAERANRLAEVMKELLENQAAFERGLLRLRSGEHTACKLIRWALLFIPYLKGMVEHTILFDEVGSSIDGSATGLYRWAYLAQQMGKRITLTLDGEWAFERILKDRDALKPIGLPAEVPLVKLPTGKARLKTSDTVPTSGIWIPEEKYGCPNYLFEGMECPPVQIATHRFFWPDRPNDIYYKYEPTPTRWQLAWEDDRYRDGKIPDESVYLDESTAFPDNGAVEPVPPLE